MNSEENLHEDFQKKPMRKTLVDKLTKEIDENLNNDQFGVDSLAQAVGMSRSSLHRKLNKTLGISTSQFIREYRLKRSLEILSKEDVTASETAYRVGFSSPTYFNTCFHKFYGFTPGEVKLKTIIILNQLTSGDNDNIVERVTTRKMVWAHFWFPHFWLYLFYFSLSPWKRKNEGNRINIRRQIYCRFAIKKPYRKPRFGIYF